MKKIDIKTWVILGLILVILFLWWRSSKLKASLNESENFIEILGDTLKTWQDKEGKARAQIGVLQSAKEEAFLALQTSDSMVLALQKVVKEFKGKLANATVITTVTKVDTFFNTIVIDSTDTDTIDGRIYVWPTYNSPFDLKGWITGEMTMNRDTAHLTQEIKNAYAVIIGQEKQGLFKKPKPFVEVINDNPYTETTGLRAYQVTDNSKKRRFNLGLYAGYGVTRLDDSSIRAGPQVGIGVTFKIW